MVRISDTMTTADRFGAFQKSLDTYTDACKALYMFIPKPGEIQQEMMERMIEMSKSATLEKPVKDRIQKHLDENNAKLESLRSAMQSAKVEVLKEYNDVLTELQNRSSIETETVVTAVRDEVGDGPFGHIPGDTNHGFSNAD